MPGPPASDTVSYLREHYPDVRVLMLTAYDDEAYVRGLVAAGVMGYVLKDEMPETIVRALHAVMRGDTWFSLPVVRKLARKGTLDRDPSLAIELTEREREVLQYLVWGLTDREIGEELYISERTVRYDLRHVYDKLGVDSRVEAAAQAVQLGLARAQMPDGDAEASAGAERESL
jgi:DNA-binding NarL/FixJ family response regulator